MCSSDLTPAEAFCQMATNVATALEIDGENSIRPVTWDEWITLPIRDGDNAVHTVRGAIVGKDSHSHKSFVGQKSISIRNRDAMRCDPIQICSVARCSICWRSKFFDTSVSKKSGK